MVQQGSEKWPYRGWRYVFDALRFPLKALTPFVPQPLWGMVYIYWQNLTALHGWAGVFVRRNPKAGDGSLTIKTRGILVSSLALALSGSLRAEDDDYVHIIDDLANGIELQELLIGIPITEEP